jgi:uncharacterized membrane protein YphA (DoxX/SURF4 family)
MREIFIYCGKRIVDLLFWIGLAYLAMSFVTYNYQEFKDYLIDTATPEITGFPFFN